MSNDGFVTTMRSTNNSTAAESSSGVNGTRSSPGTPSGRRLVASTCTPGQRPDKCSTAVRAAPTTSSQLSSTISTCRSRSQPAALSNSERPGSRRTCNPSAIAESTVSAPIPANPTKYTPSGNVPQQPLRDLRRQASLAQPARTGQHHHPIIGYTDDQSVELRGASPEAGRPLRQPHRHRPRDTQRRKQLVTDLIHALWDRQVLQALLAEIGEPASVEQLRRRRRHQDLPPMAGSHQARRSIHRRSEVVTVALIRRPRMDSHPHRDTNRLRPHLARQRTLRGDRRFERILRPRERGIEPVARRSEHIPAALGDRGSHDHVMTRQCHSHLLGEVLPQPRRRLDVGQQERHRPRRR